MNERIPPHNDDAEKSVLGSIILDKEALYEVLEFLKGEDFYNESHQEIYAAIVELYHKSIAVDILTLTEELSKRKTLEMVGGRSYLATLSTLAPSTSNAGQYAKIVGQKAVLRRLIKESSGIIEKCYQEKMDPDEVLSSAEQGIFEIAQNRQKRDYQNIKDVLLGNVNKLAELSKMEGELTGLTTGFMDLDAMTAGLQKSDLIIIAARPSMGKTAFALNIAQHASQKGKASVLIFSLEMAAEQLGQRLLSMESSIEMGKLKIGNLDRNDWDQINIALDTLSKANINIDDTPGISIMEIKNKCRRMKAEQGLDLIILDYLQLMSLEGKNENRQQEISTLSRYLKQLAREIDCPVIVLSQLSRAPEQRTDHRPMLSDLRESGAIEQDADIVMFLYRDEHYNKETDKQNICEVNIAKQRSGATGTVELTWIGKYTRFANTARKNLA